MPGLEWTAAKEGLEARYFHLPGANVLGEYRWAR